MDYESLYAESLKQIMTLRRQLRASQVQATLAKLAHTQGKSQHLKHLECKLDEELRGHNRGERIDVLLELIQDTL